jgi:hypothetical protein
MSKILAVHRLLDPSSELSIAEGGYEKTALSDLLGVPSLSINDDRLYRALDRLLPQKAALEEHLKERAGKLFGQDYELLLYDLTSTYFEGACNAKTEVWRQPPFTISYTLAPAAFGCRTRPGMLPP